MKEIISLQHPLIKHLVKLRQNSDYRYDHHTALVEGVKMIKELAKTHAFKVVLATDPNFIPSEINAHEKILVTEEVLNKTSGLSSPEGVLAEIILPPPVPLAKIDSLLVLDGINDPGNLGTLFRTALALGWGGIFLINDSCDPYNEKALRAARGATFRIPFQQGSWEEVAKIAASNQLNPLVADLKGDLPSKIDRPLLILSNEAHGPTSQSHLKAAKVTVPMPGPMESLNVGIAGGILMYALRGGK